MIELLYAVLLAVAAGFAGLVGATCMGACSEARYSEQTRYAVASFVFLSLALIGSVIALYWLGRAVFAGVCR